MPVKSRSIGRRKRIAEDEKKLSRKEEREELIKNEFNSGRESENGRWCKAIDERIRELELQVGIPELRKLREKTRLRWT